MLPPQSYGEKLRYCDYCIKPGHPSKLLKRRGWIWTERTLVNAYVLCLQSPFGFPSWTSRVRSPSPALYFQELPAFRNSRVPQCVPFVNCCQLTRAASSVSTPSTSRSSGVFV